MSEVGLDRSYAVATEPQAGLRREQSPAVRSSGDGIPWTAHQVQRG